MKLKLTVKGISSISELKLRKEMWREVLTIMKRYDLKKVEHYGAGICQFAISVIDRKKKYRDNLPPSWNIDLREDYPELIAYRPKTSYQGANMYWWKDTSVKAFQRRIKVVESIIADLENEIQSRLSVPLPKMRLRLWKKTKETLSKMGPDNSSGICSALSLSRFDLGEDLYPSIGHETCEKNYPEMYKYFPGKYYEDTYYWWNPYTKDSFKKRMAVVDSIIKDLSEIVDQ